MFFLRSLLHVLDRLINRFVSAVVDVGSTLARDVSTLKGLADFGHVGLEFS